jgi:HEPN domain-containing protein
VLDVDKHIAYWRAGAEDDIESAEVLLSAGKNRQGLFFAHLALEKALKAHVSRKLGQVPPRTHDLIRLAQVAELAVSNEQLAVLKLTMRYCLEGRYPENWPEPPSVSEARQTMQDV